MKRVLSAIPALVVGIFLGIYLALSSSMSDFSDIKIDDDITD